jgi:predicted PurR-regulated permease PerM
MNLRKWNFSHTKGLLIGLISPIVCIPIVIFIMAWLQNYPFGTIWHKFLNEIVFTGKYLSISCISNLVWFYLSLNREKYNFAMGVILGTFCYLPYILYINFYYS